MKKDKVLRTIIGRVLSRKMDKTITVAIERTVPHPVYGKFMKRTRVLLAHDEDSISSEGDAVVVSECRPISKRKMWKLERIIHRAS